MSKGNGTVRAAGGIIWRPAADGCEVLIIHRDRYDDWTFPKGKLDPGEGWKDGARREVHEETGMVVELGVELATTTYVDQKGRDKKVRYWAMTLQSTDDFQPNDEVDVIEWLSPEAARDRLTYKRDIDVLDSFTRIFPKIV